jgi:hypothetical protein
MPLGWALAGSAVLGFLGSQEQAGAAENAANLQYQGTQEAARQQREMFDILNKQQEPYREFGYGGLTKINQMLPYFTQQEKAYRPFTAQDLKTNLAPNYEFMKQQGLGATAQSANVASPGSNVDIAKTKFAEDYASNAYQNALANYMTQQAQGFNQGQTQQSNIFNRLASIAGIGQAAQGQAQNLGQQTSTNLANLATGGANALAGGQIGAANAAAGGYQNIGNAGMLYSMLSPSGGSNVSGSNFMKQYNAIGQ